MIIRNLKIKKLAVITGFIMLVLHVGKADCSDDVKHIFEILRKSISPTGVLATFDLSNAFTFKFKSTFGGMATMTVVLPDKYERGKKYDLVVYFPGGDGDPWQPYYFYQTQQNGSLKDYISNMDKILVLVKLNLPLQSKIDKNKRTLVNNFLDIDNGLKLVLNALENPGNIYLLGISFGGLYGSHYLAWRHRSVGVAGVLFLAPVSPIEPYVYRPLPELKIGFKEYFIPKDIRAVIVVTTNDTIVIPETQMTLVAAYKKRTNNFLLIEHEGDHHQTNIENVKAGFSFLLENSESGLN